MEQSKQRAFPDSGWFRPLGFSNKRHFWIRDKSPAVASFYETGCKKFSMGWPGDGVLRQGAADEATDCPRCIKAYRKTLQLLT